LSRFLIKAFDPEAVVFDTASGDTHYLSPLAQTIYSICLERPGISSTDIDPILAQRLDIPLDPTLHTETLNVLTHLRQIGLIEMP